MTEEHADDEFRALIQDAAATAAARTPSGSGGDEGPSTSSRPAAPLDDRVGTGAQHSFPTGSWLDEQLARIPGPVRRGLMWAAPVGVLAIAACTRLIGLQSPDAVVFDETYYVKDAWATWNLGYESNWPADANDQWAAGDPNGYLGTGSFAVHPPLGKWIIGLFEWLVGPSNPYSWRLGTAVFGILLVAAIMFATWLLMKSVPWATLAGFLLAIDGNGIVMSRVGLLDVFVAFFALLAFIFILLDRQRTIRTGALWWRPWLLAAGVALGADTAVKWNGLWFAAAFGIFSVVADPLTRRSTWAFVQRVLVNVVLIVPIALVTYLSTWIGWFRSTGGYDRQWADTGANAWSGPLAWVPHSIQSFIHLEQAIYQYHIGEDRPHAYAAQAWTWLLMIRPTSMYYQSSAYGDPGCNSTSCGASILDIANPLIWWASAAAAIYLVVRLIRRREWQVGVVLLALGAGYLPWLAYPDRTIFQFYTISFEPYLLIALVMAAKAVFGSPGDERRRRKAGWWTLGVFLVLSVAIAIYFWPLYTGETEDYTFIASHWWLPGWR